LDECKTLLTETCNALRKFPDSSAVRMMQRWQTEFVVVDEQAMKRLEPRWDATIAAQSLVTLAYRSNGYSVYRLKHYGVKS
jgi:hypothetical protein